MPRRTSRIAPGDIEYLPTSTTEQLAHADALRRRGEAHPDRRAQCYAEAAEYYAAAGHNETAEELFRTALEDGGHVAGSLHGFYAEFLFTQHRPDEALALIETARKQRPDDPDVFVIIGETLDEHGHHEQAARWLTTGLVRYYGDLTEITTDDLEDDPDGRIMAADRLRARRNAELAPDHIDNLIAALIENTNEA
ncbi:tetratricopeptide repeat protein [Actinospica durhamensis]|uniref:Tetratricopeptide repeat protein n=1 Tax=Actinospica durhamensis TaxID=1508375 RepID=A0A941EXE8_9ACTN|nr:tetratricopeptide repeat protein [Actinospica durhamensis]MBR7839620.1 tetratricopeptide repeat protein [Actinospica durhamensis]